MTPPSSALVTVPRTSHTRLVAWVDEIAALTQPSEIHWCDGSAEEYELLAQRLVEAGTFERLSEAKRPNSYLALSDPDDVARVEDRTFICCEHESDAGPTNNWREPKEMRTGVERAVRGLDAWAHDVRGPVLDGSARVADLLHRRAADRLGVRRSSMRIMTRMGQPALEVLGDDGDFVPCLHSVGCRCPHGREDVPWPCDAENKYIVAFPRDARDLVLRLGLRRQCAAGQEVLRAADRFGHGPRRRLARRAHADPESHLARRRGQVRDRRVPERVRQDQPRDADSDASGLEGRDDRR